MARIALILSLCAFVLFNYAQYQGWNAFADSADPQPMRSSGGSSRTYHK